MTLTELGSRRLLRGGRICLSPMSLQFRAENLLCLHRVGRLWSSSLSAHTWVMAHGCSFAMMDNECEKRMLISVRHLHSSERYARLDYDATDNSDGWLFSIRENKGLVLPTTLNWQQVIIHCQRSSRGIIKSSSECYHHFLFVCLGVLRREYLRLYIPGRVESSCCCSGTPIDNMDKIWSHLLLNSAYLRYDIFPAWECPVKPYNCSGVFLTAFLKWTDRKNELRWKVTDRQTDIQTGNEYKTNRLTEPIIVCICIAL